MEEKFLKERKLKRLLGVVLAMAMVLTLLPYNSMTAYAAESTVTADLTSVQTVAIGEGESETVIGVTIDCISGSIQFSENAWYGYDGGNSFGISMEDGSTMTSIKIYGTISSAQGSGWTQVDDGYYSWTGSATSVKTGEYFRDVTKIEVTVQKQHSWSYKEDGSAIFAACDQNCDDSELHTASLLLEAQTPVVYSGDKYEGASVKPTAEWNKYASELATPEVTYQGRGTTNYAESKTAPSAVGTYTVSVTVGDATVTADFEITSPKTTPAASDFTYEGSTGTVSAAAGKDLGAVTIYYKVGDTWTTTKPTAEGSYTVGVVTAGSDTYESTGSASEPFTADNAWIYHVISKPDLGPLNPEPPEPATPEAVDFTYNSSTGTMTATGNRPLGTITTYYKVGDTWTTTKPTAEGSYTVGVVTAGSDTYESTGSASEPFTADSAWTYEVKASEDNANIFKGDEIVTDKETLVSAIKEIKEITDTTQNITIRLNQKPTTTTDIVKEKAKTYDGYGLGSSMDIKLQYCIEGGDWLDATLDKAIEVQIEIPSDIWAADREYILLHNHDGNVEAIRGKVSSQKFTFSVSSFSEFAFLYRTKEDTSEDNGSSEASCAHEYEWSVIEKPTYTRDGKMAHQCTKCGHYDSDYPIQPISAYKYVCDEAVKQIKKASQGADISIDFGVFDTFPDYLLQAIADRTDLTIRFTYKTGKNVYERIVNPGTVLPDELPKYAGSSYLDGYFEKNLIKKMSY